MRTPGLIGDCLRVVIVIIVIKIVHEVQKDRIRQNLFILYYIIYNRVLHALSAWVAISPEIALTV